MFEIHNINDIVQSQSLIARLREYRLKRGQPGEKFESVMSKLIFTR